ncbi:MAG: D-glucuronyl C5-epimerase family protein [Bacteroidales bacterium]|nr:D-glucuronyl C5-epimerase family protein [Bacteroidales bacterium]
MKGVDNSIVIDVGNISWDKNLGAYYQDISQAIVHIDNKVFAALDENGIPYTIHGKNKNYPPIITIQYALMQYDFYIKGIEAEKAKAIFLNCVNWLENKTESLKNSLVIKEKYNPQYNIPEGWVSGMAQGQLLSVFLRAYQLLNDEKYLNLSHKVYNSFFLEYEEGGFRRIDKNGYLWFEEYPTKTPSYVLNGFIFSIFGVLDYYRLTGNQEAKNIWDACVETLEANLHKYDVWYWSVYDQLKEQLVSYYYQKNVHIPLMKIMYLLTEKEIFNHYALKWQKNLNNKFHNFITKIMYRVQPRLKKLKKK